MPKSSQITVKEIKLLCDKYSYWQVRWIGEIGTNYITEELTVKIYLIPLKTQSKVKEAELNNLLLNNEFDYDSEEEITVSVGYLPLLIIGSIFYKGRFHLNPDYETKIFHVDVNDYTQKIISLNEELPHFYGDSYTDDWSRLFSQTTPKSKGKCLYLHLPEVRLNWIDASLYDFMDYCKPNENYYYRGLIIPCMEMMAYYYAVSSKMFQQLLVDGLGTPNRIFNEEKSYYPFEFNSNKLGHLRLTKHIPYSDLLVVAPLAFDDYARNQGRNIYISRLRNLRTKNENVPEVKFPFTDSDTTLVVHGKTIFPDQLNPYFLVYWIERCLSVPLFTHFGAWRDNANYYPKESDNNNAEFDFADKEYNDFFADQPEFKTKHHGERDKSEPLLTSLESPSKYRKYINIPHPRHKFGALDSTGWFFDPGEDDIRNKSMEMIIDEIIFTEQEKEIISTSPPRGSAKVTEAVFEMKEPPQPDLLKDFEEADLMKGGRIFFQKVINLIPLLNRRVKVNPVFSTEKVSISNQDNYEYTNADNYFPTRSENELIDWSTKLINQEKRSLRIAELLFFECNYAYLFEIEPVKQHSIYSKEDQHTMFLCYKINGFGKLSNSQIQEILTICAKNEGSWLKKDEIDWLGRYKFKHSSKTYKRYAVRILTELKKAKWFFLKQSYK